MVIGALLQGRMAEGLRVVKGMTLAVGSRAIAACVPGLVCWVGRPASAAARASNTGFLPWLEKLLQHLQEFFLVGDGDVQKVGLHNAFQGILQRTGRRGCLPRPAVKTRRI